MEAAVGLLLSWGGGWRVVRSLYVSHRHLKNFLLGIEKRGLTDLTAPGKGSGRTGGGFIVHLKTVKVLYFMYIL